MGLVPIRPAERTLEASASTLVDLKVELTRKQTEYQQLKLGHAATAGSARKGKGPSFLQQNPGVAARRERDRVAAAEESKDLARSQQALVAKAALYARLHADGASMCDEDAAQFLVDFEEKRLASKDSKSASLPGTGPETGSSGPAAAADEQWVSYTDAFGRDRLCRRDELSEKLAAVKSFAGNTFGDTIDPPAGRPSGERDLMSADMRQEAERQRWEADAIAASQSNGGAVAPVHFQGVVPGEIRELGTGYFRFSTDEQERADQMQELDTLRDQTIEQRRRREQLKKRRQAAHEVRLAKIKKRKGLPVETSTPEHTSGDRVTAGATEQDSSETLDQLLAFYKEKSKENSDDSKTTLSAT